MVGAGEMRSGTGLCGEAVTDAVEEQKRNAGDCGRGEESARVSRLCRPVMWSGTKLRRRVLKLTDQAAWMIRVVRVARSA